MDVSKRFCDEERKSFFWNKGGVKGVLCKNILSAEISQTSLTLKNSENVVKSGCFKKLL